MAAPSPAAPPLDEWLAELELEVVGGGGGPQEAAFSRDLVLDGERRFDLRVTVAWVAGLGLSLWAYYGPEAMEIPKRTFQRMLRASFDYPLVKFAMTDDDRPMLMTELPPPAATRDELGRALTRLVIVADRLLEETANAVADHARLPDWTGRAGRNPSLLASYRAEVEAGMPDWEPPPPRRPRRSLLARLLGSPR
jgi:hypothetical protein